MKFFIKRLPSEDEGRRYHLFDPDGTLLLVADHGSPWLPDEPFRHVRFARPDGHPVAFLDLPWVTDRQRNRAGMSYAVIFDHAVYAIINAFVEGDRPFVYYTAEVEGQRWLVMSGDGGHGVYAERMCRRGWLFVRIRLSWICLSKLGCCNGRGI